MQWKHAYGTGIRCFSSGMINADFHKIQIHSKHHPQIKVMVSVNYQLTFISALQGLIRFPCNSFHSSPVKMYFCTYIPICSLSPPCLSPQLSISFQTCKSPGNLCYLFLLSVLRKSIKPAFPIAYPTFPGRLERGLIILWAERLMQSTQLER